MDLDALILNFDHSFVGRKSEPSQIGIDAAQLKFFAKATDQRDPVFFDEAAAKAAGHCAIPVPPTFAFSLTLAAPEQAAFGLIKVQANPGYVLHGEQGFSYHHLLYAGDEVSIVTEIRDMYEKKGGALRFLAQRSELRNQAGILCVENLSTFVLRYPDAVTQ